jgi:peptide/nickel transport system substrate-binding protein
MLYAPIRTIEALDSLTVRFTLTEPYAPFLRYLDVGIVPKHLVESGHNLSVSPVGSGPYVLARWDKGSRIELVANAAHWNGEPNVPRIDIVLIPDNTARAQAFEAGDLDLIQSPLAPQDVVRLSDDDRFVQQIRLGNAITYLNFNTMVPLLSDPQLRIALAKLVDRETIVNRIYENIDTEATSIFPPTSWAYSEEVQQPEFDPDGAGMILVALGWRDSNGDGVLDKSGQRLSLRLGTHSEDVNRVQTVELLQNSFAAHGVETRVEISDWASFAVRRDAGDFDIILLGWTQLVDPDRVTFEQLHSSGGLNWGGYRNPRLDLLLSRGRSVQQQEDRAVAYREAAGIIAGEVPYYVLSHQGYQVFHSPRIIGFLPDPRGMLRSLTRASLSDNR